ncbi:embryonic polarity dorsal, putative [Pediculus humanus corporis]|uniref:Embryonic polarity dorsal, putative n=1 Tax=Pediculus humanus subsp. corporis TaxID=121224 RepID=E0VZH4_PEDHC|nr:embryonic polarity dorsal, putative [Pediculus humanus corporis]EEB18780.1 embryonic polarity dorsal, putative [Pediculus humanus corporis]
MDAERSSGVNISDVIEVIETDEMYAGALPNNGEPDSRRPRAYVKIIEQPASKALRFRYECEGRSAGSIPGVNSTPENKTYPGIQIVGHNGRAVVVVSCVTKDAPYRPHPHNLVGKEGCSRGVCTLKMNSDTITFSNLGIQCVKKKDIEEALKVREEIRVDPFRTGFSHKVQPSSIDLNSVRLCFQVFLEGPKKEEFTIPLRPIVSDPIYDKKAMSDLTICKLSDCSASVAGGKEIILLCEKVAKEDIQIRFYEERDGDLFWEGLGDFQPTQVHKQVAISFRTPKYKNIDVEKPVKVWVQLRRPSDGAVSESVPFQFIPLDSGRATFWSLKRVLSKKGDYNTFSKILNENAPLTPETQKRKFESLTANSVCEGKKPLLERPDFGNRKDSLISGGSLVVVPNQDNSTMDSKTVAKTQNLERLEQENPRNNFINDKESMRTGNNQSIHESNKRPDEVYNSNVEDRFSQNEIKGIQNNSEPNDNSQSFNDLITQVAELDEIYAETREKLILSHPELDNHLENMSVDCRDSFRDNQTYTSLQLAMKNPIESMESRCYEDVPVIQGPLININENKLMSKMSSMEEKLPPLPPKRVKKTPPRRPDDSPLHKDLPKTPESTKTKQNLFQKLFSSKNKVPNSVKMKTSQSSESLKSADHKPASPNTLNTSKSSLNVGENKTANEKSLNKWFHQSLENQPNKDGFAVSSPDDLTAKTEKDQVEKESEGYLLTRDDLELGMDLTEAENYALYTSIAPHASMTELDEISFYYSPVEKGKILTGNDFNNKLKDIEMKTVTRPQNVT